MGKVLIFPPLLLGIKEAMGYYGVHIEKAHVTDEGIRFIFSADTKKVEAVLSHGQSISFFLKGVISALSLVGAPLKNYRK